MGSSMVGKNATDAMFSLRMLMEKCRESCIVSLGSRSSRCQGAVGGAVVQYEEV